MGKSVSKSAAEMQAIAESLNLRYMLELDLSKVEYGISPKDDMYVEGLDEHYLNVGLSGVSCVLAGLECLGIDRRTVKVVLDYPCGYGRVLRFLKASFPDAKFTGCDIQAPAIEFVEEKFQARTVLGHRDFRKVRLMEHYDLIWCGSLFTHISSDDFHLLFRQLWSCVKGGGALVFTTIGRTYEKRMREEKLKDGLTADGVEDLLRQYDRSGHGYVRYPGTDDYGLSLIKPSWVAKSIEEAADIERLIQQEGRYDDMQDLTACKKAK